ncbi:MAG: hypothetical protein H7833_19115 [Magnetococcus sp. DMHC-1]|nr:hypothetical protein [Magnetococcales bacterium]
MKQSLIPGLVMMFFVSGCVVIHSPYTKGENDLIEKGILGEDLEYYKQNYMMSDKNEAFYGSMSIQAGKRITNVYDEKINKIKNGNMPTFEKLYHVKDAVYFHLDKYSEIWSTSISFSCRMMNPQQKVWKPTSETVNDSWLISELRKTPLTFARPAVSGASPNIDFVTALEIAHTEFTRVGVFARLDAAESLIIEDLKEIDRKKYAKTIDLYGVLSQMIALAKYRRGSLETFNANINLLMGDFDRTLALARLEYQSNGS